MLKSGLRWIVTPTGKTQTTKTKATGRVLKAMNVAECVDDYCGEVWFLPRHS